MAPKYIGPFKVKRVINDVTCELELPEKMKIFNKFHASLLKAFQGRIPEKIHVHPGFLSTEPIEEYEVEDILQDRIEEVDGKKIRFFLVKWKNTDVQHSTWEPQSHLANARAVLRRYMKKKEDTDTTKR